MVDLGPDPVTHTGEVIAAIVTYNPDLSRLAENLESVARQVSTVLIFDNGSEQPGGITDLAKDWPNVELMLGGHNFGIATALNRLASEAERRGATHLLTLDQDSVASRHMVSGLMSCMSSGVAIATPFIVDRNKADSRRTWDAGLPALQDYLCAARKGAITSGAVLLLSAWKAVGGFDSRLFIDYVDYDLNARLLLRGFRIVRVNSVELLHEVGRARPTWLSTPRRGIDGRWRVEQFYSFGHGPERCYYKARNRVIYTRKYRGRFANRSEGAWQIPQQVLLTLLFEDRKREKLVAFMRGVVDGMRMRLD